VKDLIEALKDPASIQKFTVKKTENVSDVQLNNTTQAQNVSDTPPAPEGDIIQG
jgi:hypothetical protein